MGLFLEGAPASKPGQGARGEGVGPRAPQSAPGRRGSRVLLDRALGQHLDDGAALDLQLDAVADLEAEKVSPSFETRPRTPPAVTTSSPLATWPLISCFCLLGAASLWCIAMPTIAIIGTRIGTC